MANNLLMVNYKDPEMESYADVKRQRDFYKNQVENYEMTIDCAKIVIIVVGGILLCCLEF
jgi:hypothetical protein